MKMLGQGIGNAWKQMEIHACHVVYINGNMGLIFVSAYLSDIINIQQYILD